MTTAGTVRPAAPWPGGRVYPRPPPALWITDKPQVPAPNEGRDCSHLRLCFTFRLQGLKGFYF